MKITMENANFQKNANKTSKVFFCDNSQSSKINIGPVFEVNQKMYHPPWGDGWPENPPKQYLNEF